MSSGDRREAAPAAGEVKNGVVSGDLSQRQIQSEPASGVVAPSQNQRLRLNPSKDHKPESYDDMQLDFSPSIFSSLERYLPPPMLGLNREEKVKFMREILMKYLPQGERTRVQRHRDYRQKIITNYQPLHRELYNLHIGNFFVPPFVKAIQDNTEESFRSIISEPSPGVFTFEMLQPRFCELLLAEVENFEKWVNEAKFRIMRPNTMNKYGAVLDDFGLETMLDKLMETYIRPLSKVFFAEVGGSTLDSHHGFVVEYGKDRDVDLGFHVDDSEVTLNVCLGKQFTGGELFFRGTRCEKHVNTGSQTETILFHDMSAYNIPDIPLCAFVCSAYARVSMLVRSLIILMSLGELFFIVVAIAMVLEPRHLVIGSIYSYGAEAAAAVADSSLCCSFAEVKMPFVDQKFIFLYSSVFREMKRYQKDFSSWCGECFREKKERQRLSIAATKSVKNSVLPMHTRTI
ncbi:2-oxoglutarate and iron-dependent oxygenase domain-containing protein CP2 [Citrus sinensis]|uniref:2-oxoglutarate and iron-dependent oxygenase domain-containing protein CP2 n=2 Tax=Citrus sinensis TaxID=2711 RepID=A0ACB8NVD9_CITSI|nr:2-oxoglutarate and iron-dependent oxygenase domain-containing protein CP2 [Citrus sinensis]